MHELDLCCALLDEVGRVLLGRPHHRVVSIVVKVGPLAGVEPELLARAYTIASAGTAAQGAALVLEAAPVRIRCRECGTSAAAASNNLTCPSCGGWRTELLSGDELLLTRVELERQTQAEEPAHV